MRRPNIKRDPGILVGHFPSTRRAMRRRSFLSLAGMTLFAAWADPVRAAQGPAATKTLPAGKLDAPAPLRFAVVGDTGTGDKYQLAVARQMAAEFDRSPYSLVLMLGDNN